MSKIPRIGSKKVGKQPLWMKDITESWDKDKVKAKNEENKNVGLPPTKTGAKSTHNPNAGLGGPLKYMKVSNSGGGFGSGLMKGSPKSNVEKKKKRKGLFSGWKSGGNKNDFFTRFFTAKSVREKDTNISYNDDLAKSPPTSDQFNAELLLKKEDESNTQMRSHIVKFMNNQLQKSLKTNKPVEEQLKERSSEHIKDSNVRSEEEKEHLFGPPSTRKKKYKTLRMANLDDFNVDPTTPGGPSSFGKEQNVKNNNRVGVSTSLNEVGIKKQALQLKNKKSIVHDRSVTTVGNVGKGKKFVDTRDRSTKEQKKHHVSYSINYSIFENMGGKTKSKVNIELEREMKKKRKTQFIQSFSSMKNKIISKIKGKKGKNLGNVKGGTKKLQLLSVFKSVSEYKNGLKSYLKKLQSVKRSCDSLIDEISRNKEHVKKQIKKNITNFRKKNLTKLIEHYRSYTIFKLMRLSERRNLEIECREIIKKRIFFTSQAIKLCDIKSNSSNTSMDSMDSITIPPYIRPKFFEEIDKILLSHPSLNVRWTNIKKLDKFENGFYKKYTFQKKIGSRMKSKKEMELFLKDKIIQKTYNFYKSNTLDFLHQDIVMSNLQKILSDRRTSIGKSIFGFLEQIHSLGMKNIPSDEYTSYIESLVNCLTSAFSIQKKSVERHILLQLTSKYIFSLIGEKLYRICTEKKKIVAKDKIYSERLLLLQNLSPIQIGVPRKFLNSDDIPGSFNEAIDNLRYVEFSNDPNDMLHCIATSSSSIGHEARMSCNRNGCKWEFGADDFFPILVYVIVKANVPNINVILDFIQKFAVLYKKEASYSEITYFKTCFEGAVMYVSEMTVKQLRTLLQEKNEKLVLKEFDPFAISISKYEEMEIALEESLKLCDVVKKSCKIKAKSEEEHERESKEREEKENKIKKKKEKDERLKREKELKLERELEKVEERITKDEDVDAEFNFNDYVEELLHSHLPEEQVNLLTSILEGK